MMKEFSMCRHCLVEVIFEGKVTKLSVRCKHAYVTLNEDDWDCLG